MEYVLSEETAARLTEILGYHFGTRFSVPRGTAAARLVIFVEVTGEIDDGFYPCVPINYDTVDDAYTSFDNALVIEANGNTLDDGGRYIAIRAGDMVASGGNIPVFVAYAGLSLEDIPDASCGISGLVNTTTQQFCGEKFFHDQVHLEHTPLILESGGDEAGEMQWVGPSGLNPALIRLRADGPDTDATLHTDLLLQGGILLLSHLRNGLDCEPAAYAITDEECGYREGLTTTECWFDLDGGFHTLTFVGGILVGRTGPNCDGFSSSSSSSSSSSMSSMSSSSSSSCSGGVEFCACDCMPTTIFATVASVSGCACLEREYSMAWNAGVEYFQTAEETVCGLKRFVLRLACFAGGFVIQGDCDGTPFTDTPASVSCDPLIITFTNISVHGGCCTGTIDITITE